MATAQERTPEEMLRQFLPGATLEPLLNLLAMARDGGDEFSPEQEVELIKIGQVATGGRRRNGGGAQRPLV